MQHGRLVRTACLLTAGALSASCEGEALAPEQLSEPLVVCHRQAHLEGIDVSEYQGTIDWPTVAGAGVRFAYVRVSDGTHHPDRTFARNWQGSLAAGLYTGAYQFFEPAQDAEAQADLLVEAMGALRGAVLPPMLDVESAGGLDAAELVAQVQRWIDRLTRRTGLRPVLYTGKYFWRDAAGDDARFAALPLWIAAYGPTCPNVPDAWHDWLFWQYSGSGQVAGIAGPVDRDRFSAEEDALAALALEKPVPTTGVAADAMTDRPRMLVDAHDPTAVDTGADGPRAPVETPPRKEPQRGALDDAGPREATGTDARSDGPEASEASPMAAPARSSEAAAVARCTVPPAGAKARSGGLAACLLLVAALQRRRRTALRR